MSNTEIIRRQIAGDEAHRPPVGAPPGTLVADPNAHETRMLVIDYGPEHFEQREISECTDLKPYIEK